MILFKDVCYNTFCRHLLIRGERLKEKIIKEVITDILLESGFTVSEIILFGSRARGNFTEESDWDILVLVKENLTLDDRKALWRKIYHTMHSYFPGISFDIIIKSQDIFDAEKDIVNTVSNEAYTEGVKL